MSESPTAPAKDAAPFIQRWSQADGSERQNYQLFLTELCELLDLPRPEPAGRQTEDNAYVFERKVTFHHADGTHSRGFIDLYKRGCFVLEAKQTGQALGSQVWGDAMLRAHGQAQQYARALPASEGRPPFLIVTDVGRNIELYSEFTRSGATYVPFPDPRSHRIRIEDLVQPAVQQKLRNVWTNPLNLDPSLESARVTKSIANDLAKLAEALEKQGYDADTVAAFLMRCLFTMFAEDVGLLPKRSFSGLLDECHEHPEYFPRLVPGLWKAMDRGGFSPEIRTDLLRFNGGIFADHQALPLDRDQIDLLRYASLADWRDVEPAIFGSLLERALDPVERHKLGAHYTPRSYVERLVMPTVIEPLRDDWTAVQAAAITLDRQGKRDAAVKEVLGFQHRLATVRVLDPACGSGNFLYVTLEHMKRLEGEVFNTLDDLGYSQGRLETAGVTVDPHQMLGLESNPRAARITEAVLWIGYLQWHFRTRGNVKPPEPVIKDYKTIEARDAVLAWDRVDIVNDENGRPVTHWDGRTTKPHPVTGEEVPDENAQVPEFRYHNPRKAEWPKADFVVGNPPYLGARTIRLALGDGYLTAIREVYSEVPDHADYVMYWWDRAAEMASAGQLRRFGFITTNSIRQSFSQKVLAKHMLSDPPVSIVFAIPDHPWIDSTDGAAVRVAMTVAAGGELLGTLNEVISETPSADGECAVKLQTRRGPITIGLRIGADLSRARELRANSAMSCVGYQLTGKGFVMDRATKESLERGWDSESSLIRPLLSGRDITQRERKLFAIDTFGLSESQLRDQYPAHFQRLFDWVKPERDHNNTASLRHDWWIFGRARGTFRPALAGVVRIVATSLTAKHRFFVSVPANTICDSTTVMFALQDHYFLGVLSSRTHVTWALAVGGRLGVGNDPRYNKTRCFEAFPFPDCTNAEATRIRDLAEQLDVRRKHRQQLHPGLTLTGIYNVLEKLRRGKDLSAKDKLIHEQGLVTVIGELHDELDAAVLEAYGWSDLAPALVGKPGGTTPYAHKSAAQTEAEETLLERLVHLNAERAAEEQRGIVRWLRPEFQNPQGRATGQESLIADDIPEAAQPAAKRPWPKPLSEQVRAIRAALAEQPGPATSQQLARGFKGAPAKRVEELLETLTALGQARKTEDNRYTA